MWVRGLCVVVPLPPWLWGLGVVPRHSWLGSVCGGVFSRRPLCVPSPLFLLGESPGALFPWCPVWVFRGCGGCAVGLRRGGGVFDAGSGPFPWCFALGRLILALPVRGVTLLYERSICTRSVQMYLLRSQVLQRFPTPGCGTLWVAGESVRDRRVSCLPRWTVCPTCSPSLGPNRSTCRAVCSWSGPSSSPQARATAGR